MLDKPGDDTTTKWLMEAGVGTLSLARISITRSPTPADLGPMNHRRIAQMGRTHKVWQPTEEKNHKRPLRPLPGVNRGGKGPKGNGKRTRKGNQIS
jgi:hypothetical protein